MAADSRAARPLQKMFSEVPATYDLINRLFTLRLDQAWRKIAAKECMRENPRLVLDLCTGTGDLALSMAGQARPGMHIAAVDFSLPMLLEGRLKFVAPGQRVGFVLGDVGKLPFREGSFDAIGIAFAFRNLVYKNRERDKYLSEILRVLSPGGKLVIVETSRPRSPLVRLLFHWYMRTAVSFLAGLISGRGAAYKYLAHSAINFYSSGDLSDLLESAGFRRVQYRTFLFGVCALHLAYREGPGNMENS